MKIVCDSGPLIHLAQVNHFSLLKEFFRELEINQVVFDEVIVEGIGRPGEKELRDALSKGWIKVSKLQNQSLIKKIEAEGLSQKDASVIALAVEKKAGLLISDDLLVRKVASDKGLRIAGTVGILTNARLKGSIPNLKTLLDKLVEQGFRLDPQGMVYKDALRKAGEL